MRVGPGLCVAWIGLLAGAAAAAERARPVPLGGGLAGQVGDGVYAVYVPTRHGGTLTVTATGGTVGALDGPDGRSHPNGQDILGPAAHGWYTFRVTATGPGEPYVVRTRFEQVGRSARAPWNYYYWPTKGDSLHEPWSGGNGRVDTPGPRGDDVMVAAYGSAIAPGQDIILPGPNGLLETVPAQGDTSTWFPNLYDDLTGLGADGRPFASPSPLLKYDQLFGLTARSWEAAYSQTQGVQRWPGHCLGGAVASIMLNEPDPAPGSGLSRDELKALWAELGENHLNHRIGDYATGIPPGPPRPGPDETDRFAPRVHQMLETNIRAGRKALLANLRSFPPRGTPNEVWNHGIGKYAARYAALPGRGERSVRVDVELEANSGSGLNGDGDKPRVVSYSYVLLYGLDGSVDETQPDLCDWVSVGGEGMYCPLNLLEIVESRWQGHNPLVTEANVRSLDRANGGGQRFAGTAPAFRPVGEQEAGRAPLISAAPAAGPGVAAGPPNSPLGALRRLFRRE